MKTDPPEDILEILARTFDDRRMSRAERALVRERLAEEAPAEDRRAYYVHRVFQMARTAVGDDAARTVVSWLEDAVKALREPPDADAPDAATACFSPGDTCRHRIAALLGAARRSVDICVFTITDDRLVDAILDAHRRKVPVRVVTDDDKAIDLGSDIDRLARAGIAVRTDRSSAHMHHKFALFDGRKLLTGSYNWTRSAASDNQENLIVTEDHPLVSAFQGEFEKLWEKFG